MLAVAIALMPVTTQAAYFDDVDYTKLKGRVGSATPTGAGGIVSIVESQFPATAPNSYLVDTSWAEFSSTTDPSGLGVSLTDGSMVARTGFSGHATGTVSQFYFGNTLSTAPGANAVVNYEANHWLSSVVLVNGSAPPTSQPYRVQNHSWVGSGNSSTELSALRRVDYLVETDDVTLVVGANNYNSMNSATWTHPTLLVYSLNSIVAGRSDGWHSRGQTNNLVGAIAYGSGRYRPDIVTPSPSTSTSTARISSAAAMLHQPAAGTDAARSEVMKAILMAGATKGEFANWIDPTTGLVNPWNRTQTRPLDDVFGAGELNVYNSYVIQLGGKQSASTVAPSAPVGAYGWDYQNRKSDGGVGDLYYNFEIPTGSSAADVSIMLVWNAKITDNNPDPNIFSPTQSIQNLNLHFYDSTNSFMGTLLDQSISTVDNVEHIYLNSLGPGTYTLKVTGAANWDYGLAWRMTTAFDQPNADFDGDGFVSGSDFLTWQRNYGKLINATNSEGDADGDGDVDQDDLSLFNAGVMWAPAPPMVAQVAAAIPEPSSILLLSLGAAAVWRARRLRREE
jgi:hypothetical protein